MKVFVYAVDASISMEKSYADMVPSKLYTAVEAVLLASKRLIQKQYRVGLVIFAGRALPLTYPTNDINIVNTAIGSINRTFEGSAPGDAVIESVKLLRPLRYYPDKKVIVVTDGDYNMGAPLENAIVYARSSGVKVAFITIGALSQVKIASTLESLKEDKLVDWYHVQGKTDLYSKLFQVSEVTT
jgi:Mg-chelatase subunit ChlD